MEAFMAGAAVTEIFVGSVIVAVVMSVWAMRGMFWLMEGAGRPAAERSQAVGGQLVPVRVRASHGQVSLRAR